MNPSLKNAKATTAQRTTTPMRLRRGQGRVASTIAASPATQTTAKAGYCQFRDGVPSESALEYPDATLIDAWT